MILDKMAQKLLPFVLIGLYLIIWTSYTFFLEVPFNEKRLIEGILLLLGVGLLCSSKVLQQRWIKVIKQLKDRSVIIWVLCGVLGLGITSSVLADYSFYAFLELSHHFLLFNLLMLGVIGYHYYPQYFEYGFLIIVGFMAGLYLVNVTISYLYVFLIPDFPLWPSTDFIRVNFKNIGFIYPEPFSNFVNIRFFNHLQTWSLPLLTLLVLHIPKRYWAFSKIAFIIACGWWMLAFASEGRGTILASFLTLAFIFIMYRKKAQQWIRTHALSAVTGLILYGIFFKLIFWSTGGENTFLSQPLDDNGRFAVWEKIIEVIIDNPLFGVGPMHFPSLESPVLATPHNLFLQFAVEWGIPAALLFTGVVIAGFYYWLIDTNKKITASEINSPSVNVRVTLTASLLAGFIHSGYSNIFNSPISQIIMVLVAGWAVGTYLSDIKSDPVEQDAARLWQRIGLIFVSLLAAGFLTWSYVSHVPDLDETRRQYIQTTQSKKLVPRYWDQGILGVEEHMRN